MRVRRVAVILASGAVAAGGAGAAVAATSGDDGRQREQSVLADAAKRLSVTPEQLRDALGDAQDAQLDRDVQAGRLTQEQADRLKRAREESGRVLGGPGPHRLGHGPGGRFGGPGARGLLGDVLGDVAAAVKLSREELVSKLRAGETLAGVARSQGVSRDTVRQAVRSAVTDRLAEAVKDGELTQAQADRIATRLDDHLDELLDRTLRGPGPGRHGPRHVGP